MASDATPRINAKYLDAFANKTVRVLGKVVSLRGETAMVEANGSIVVHLNREAHLTLNNAAELVGKVQPDLSIKAFQSTDFGNNIDFAAVEALVDATHRYKEIFYESADQ